MRWLVDRFVSLHVCVDIQYNLISRHRSEKDENHVNSFFRCKASFHPLPPSKLQIWTKNIRQFTISYMQSDDLFYSDGQSIGKEESEKRQWCFSSGCQRLPYFAWKTCGLRWWSFTAMAKFPRRTQDNNTFTETHKPKHEAEPSELLLIGILLKSFGSPFIIVWYHMYQCP